MPWIFGTHPVCTGFDVEEDFMEGLTLDLDSERLRIFEHLRISGIMLT